MSWNIQNCHFASIPKITVSTLTPFLFSDFKKLYDRFVVQAKFDFFYHQYFSYQVHPPTDLKPMKKILLAIIYLIPLVALAQAKVDTIEVYSPAMKKNLKAAVTTPSSYQSGNKKYPVVYLLHGGSGAFSDWHQKVSEPGLVGRMAEKYDLIIVTPGVGPASYYYDSHSSIQSVTKLTSFQN